MRREKDQEDQKQLHKLPLNKLSLNKFSGGSSILFFNLYSSASSFYFLTLSRNSSLSFWVMKTDLPFSASTSLSGLSFLSSKNCVTSRFSSLIFLASSSLNSLRSFPASKSFIVFFLSLISRPCY